MANADFTGAEVRNADFSDTVSRGFTEAQLYATASYESGILRGINLGGNDLSSWDLAGQDLTSANFDSATLIDADFGQANFTNADFSNATLTSADFSQAHLIGADVADATLTNANFTGAEVMWADFRDVVSRGFTARQLYSTASYQAGDLTGIFLDRNDLSGWDFPGQNLTNAVFVASTLINAKLSQADLTNADFSGATLTDAGLSQANLTSADLSGATLTNADFTGAEVRGANFEFTGFTAEQLYSTASYQAGDLTGIRLQGNYLSGWDFAGQNLANALLSTTNFQSTLTNADFSQAILTNAGLSGSTLTNADFAEAVVRGADFSVTVQFGFTAEQLYSTASYQAGDLTGIRLQGNDLSGWDFAGQNLTNAVFVASTLINAKLSQANLTSADMSDTTLTDAGLGQANLTSADLSGATLTNLDLTGAEVRGADFSDTVSRGFTAGQFYSTVSYQVGDLTGIGLGGNDLSGWDFAGQNLTNAIFSSDFSSFTRLTNADFTGAEVKGANFSGTVSGGFTAEQLHSTASYQAGDLTGIRLGRNDLSGWDFTGQNLTNADFFVSTLINADFSQANFTNANLTFAHLTNSDFTGAEVRGANFDSTGFTAEQLYSTASYQAGDLTGILLLRIDLSGWEFAGQNLTNAMFSTSDFSFVTRSTRLTNADFTGAEVKGANFGSTRGFTAEQLYSTASYRAGDLTGIGLDDNDLSGWDFAEQNVNDANFESATLTNADFTGAEVKGANFGSTRGFTAEQLYSTASYKAGDLTGIGLGGNDLSGWDFAGQNLTNADFVPPPFFFLFSRRALAIADFIGADTRGAVTGHTELTAGITNNMIWPDGHIEGLELVDGRTLVVRDYDGNPNASPSPLGPIGILVEERLVMDATGTLRMLLEEDDWDSLISFAPRIPVDLAGALELNFSTGVDVASQVGRTIRLFDWSDVAPAGKFGVVRSDNQWDLSQLYLTGEVTLTAVPEPGGPFLVGMYLLGAALLAGPRNAAARFHFHPLIALTTRT